MGCLPLLAQTGAGLLRKNEAFVTKVLSRLTGRESDAAARVFKNVRLDQYKGIPAKQFLLVMNVGFSQALGVTCTHCHIEDDFASGVRRQKHAAREMVPREKPR